MVGRPEHSQINHQELNIKYHVSDLIMRSTATFLMKYFGGNIGHEVDINRGHIGFGILHYAFITTLRPGRVLCIGSQKGFIPAICAIACKDNNFGHIDFVDAGKGSRDTHSWGGIGFWKIQDNNEHFSPFNLNQFITTYVMTSKKFASKYRRKYEYIYIDGDHSYEGVKSDFEAYWPKLKPGGIMSFHDITLKGKSQGIEFGVWKLWKELDKKHFISIIARENGVGFIQKQR